MPIVTLNGELVWKRRTTTTQLRNWAAWLIGIAIISFAWHLISEKTVWFFVQDAPRQAADMGARMVPPKWSYMSQLWKPTWDTINIASIGTIIAMVIAIPVAFAAARSSQWRYTT